MPSFYMPEWNVVHDGDDYLTNRKGCTITYRPDAAQHAQISLDNTDGSLNGVFSEEDPASVKIDSVAMLDGYIVRIMNEMVPETKDRPGRRINKILEIADGGGLLAAKTEFDQNYIRSKNYRKLFQDVASALGVSSSVSANLTDEFKRDFFGSYCRDALMFGAEKGGADWFFDESGVLNAFEHEGMTLTTGATAYQLQDIVSAASNQITVKHNQRYWIQKDAMQRFRNVKVKNTSWETFPHNIHQVTNESFWNGTLGYNYARWISAIERAGLTNRFRPIKLEPGPQIGGSTTNDLAPAAAFETESTSDKLMSTFWYVSSDDSSMVDAKDFGLPMGAYEYLQFHLLTDIDLGDASAIRLELLDHTTPLAAFYRRDIKGDLNGSDVWTYLRYALPTVTSGADGTVSNGWTKHGANDFNYIDTVFIDFRKTSSGNNTGWPIGSKIKYATFFFSRRVAATATGSGGLNTTKVIVNNTVQNKATLQIQANKELARIGSAAVTGYMVAQGHTDFKRPGYMVNYNFNQTFGSGHSGSARMDQIIHKLDEDGRYLMEISLKPAFQRI